MLGRFRHAVPLLRLRGEPIASCLPLLPHPCLPFPPSAPYLQKAATVRTATAGARVLLGRRVFDLVASNQLAKGDVLTVAQLAGE